MITSYQKFLVESANDRKKLLQACLSDDVEAAKAAIEAGARPNYDGSLPLRSAAMKGSIRVMEYLVSLKNVEYHPISDKHYEKWTENGSPLMHAIRSGQYKAADVILRGLNKDIRRIKDRDRHNRKLFYICDDIITAVLYLLENKDLRRAYSCATIFDSVFIRRKRFVSIKKKIKRISVIVAEMVMDNILPEDDLVLINKFCNFMTVGLDFETTYSGILNIIKNHHLTGQTDQLEYLARLINRDELDISSTKIPRPESKISTFIKDMASDSTRVTIMRKAIKEGMLDSYNALVELAPALKNDEEQNMLNAMLWRSVRRSDHAYVQRLLDQGADPNYEHDTFNGPVPVIDQALSGFQWVHLHALVKAGGNKVRKDPLLAIPMITSYMSRDDKERQQQLRDGGMRDFIWAMGQICNICKTGMKMDVLMRNSNAKIRTMLFRALLQQCQDVPKMPSVNMMTNLRKSMEPDVDVDYYINVLGAQVVKQAAPKKDRAGIQSAIDSLGAF